MPPLTLKKPKLIYSYILSAYMVHKTWISYEKQKSYMVKFTFANSHTFTYR